VSATISWFGSLIAGRTGGGIVSCLIDKRTLGTVLESVPDLVGDGRRMFHQHEAAVSGKRSWIG